MSAILRTIRPAAALALLHAMALGACTRPVPPAKPPANVAAPPPPPTPTATATATTPAPKAEPSRQAPPEPLATRDYRFPTVAWNTLESGLPVATIESHALPIVQIRFVVRAGRSADGATPAIASLTADLLKDGGAANLSSKELLSAVESLGASLSVETGFDKTVVGLAVTKDRLAEALTLLSSVVAAPRMDASEFAKLKKREMDRVADAARTSGSWAAAMVLYRDLFGTKGTTRHPYATVDATPKELEAITLDACRAFHRRLYVPKNAFLVIAGDVNASEVQSAAAHAFGRFTGAEPQATSFAEPTPPSALRITVVDRPKSSQSDVFVGTLGPRRSDPAWASFAVANQILGGGVSGRLFLDVRERQSLAYNTRSTLRELAYGPAPIVAYAGTQTAETGLAVKALLEHLDRLATTAPTDVEVRSASRYLADVFAIRLETLGALADELVSLHTLGLPDDYDDGYRKELGRVAAADVARTASANVRLANAAVVVAGDAAIVAPMLSHFGDVHVLDPVKDFAEVRILPKNGEAPLQAPRSEGR